MGTFADSDDYDSELDRDDLSEKLEKIGEDGVKKLQQFESYQKQVEEHGLLPRNDLERRQKADAAKRMKHLEDRRIQITKMKEVKRRESGKEKSNTPGEVHYQRISTQLKEQVSSGEISVDDIKVKLVETRQSQTKISKAMANTKDKKSEVYMEMKKQISLVRAELRALDELRSNLVSKRTSSRNTVKGNKAKPSALNLEGKKNGGATTNCILGRSRTT